MTIKQIIDAKPVLDRIAQNKEIPTKVAYKIYILLSSLNPAIQFFLDKRKELFLNYGKEDGENFVITEENQLIFSQKFDELMDIECTNEIQKIDISLDVDLGISPSEIFLLESFINFIE